VAEREAGEWRREVGVSASGRVLRLARRESGDGAVAHGAVRLSGLR
jgi:hypothetical protein